MKSFSQLTEGLYDPNIFKAVFLAGGPGSGKSYVVKRTTGGLGMRIINSDDAFENLMKKAELSLEKDVMTPKGQELRGRAKELTKTKEKNYLEGRLGIIIDGTGRDYEKLTGQAKRLQKLGYDTYMIFVNTSLDVAKERNEKRPRRISDELVTKYWNDVQRNIGKFQNFFRSGFVVVDNNDAGEDIFQKVFKRIRGLVTKKNTNPIALRWMKQELEKRKKETYWNKRKRK